METVFLEYGALGLLVAYAIKNKQSIENKYESLTVKLQDSYEATIKDLKEQNEIVINSLRADFEHRECAIREGNRNNSEKYDKLIEQIQEEHRIRESLYIKREELTRQDINDFKNIMQKTTLALNSIVDRLDNIENVVLEKGGKQ